MNAEQLTKQLDKLERQRNMAESSYGVLKDLLDDGLLPPEYERLIWRIVKYVEGG